LQGRSSSAMMPDSIRAQPVRHLAPPLRFHPGIAFCGSDYATCHPCPDGLAQRCVTKTTKINGFAIHGAAMLAGFYHRSVLRCGCLAERNPGVEGILTGAPEIGSVIVKKANDCRELGTPGQRGLHNSNLWNLRGSAVYPFAW
jgi:hypothetical protein